MKVSDTEEHFRESGAPFSGAVAHYIEDELYTCVQCGDDFDNRNDLNGEGLCYDCRAFDPVNLVVDMERGKQ